MLVYPVRFGRRRMLYSVRTADLVANISWLEDSEERRNYDPRKPGMRPSDAGIPDRLDRRLCSVLGYTLVQAVCPRRHDVLPRCAPLIRGGCAGAQLVRFGLPADGSYRCRQGVLQGESSHRRPIALRLPVGGKSCFAPHARCDASEPVTRWCIATFCALLYVITSCTLLYVIMMYFLFS